jgi:hypothetical protein
MIEKFLRIGSIFQPSKIGLGENRKTTMRREEKTADHNGRLARRGLPGFLSGLRQKPLLGFVLLCASLPAWAFQHQAAAHPAMQVPHPAPAPHMQAPSRPAQNTPARPNQQHLPEWWNNHRNLSPDQRAEALRREPGFRSLPQDQQQRLLNRMQTFSQRPPEQQQRTMARNEAFQQLPPQRRQEVLQSSHALSQMSPDRKRIVGQAFQQLRNLPPQQRQQFLNSGSYTSQFSPQERTVLSNMLSIEPYQPHGIPQPYFGR